MPTLTKSRGKDNPERVEWVQGGNNVSDEKQQSEEDDSLRWLATEDLKIERVTT